MVVVWPCTAALDGQEGQPRHVRPGGQDQLCRLPRIAGTHMMSPQASAPHDESRGRSSTCCLSGRPFCLPDVLHHLRTGVSLWSATMVAHSRPPPRVVVHLRPSTGAAPPSPCHVMPNMPMAVCRVGPTTTRSRHWPQPSSRPLPQSTRPTSIRYAPHRTPAETPHGTALLRS